MTSGHAVARTHAERHDCACAHNPCSVTHLEPDVSLEHSGQVDVAALAVERAADAHVRTREEVTVAGLGREREFGNQVYLRTGAEFRTER